MGTLLTPAAYARYRGITRQAVAKAIASRRIDPVKGANGRTMIDAEMADRQWSARTDSLQQERSSYEQFVLTHRHNGRVSLDEAFGGVPDRIARRVKAVIVRELRAASVKVDGDRVINHYTVRHIAWDEIKSAKTRFRRGRPELEK